MTPGVRFEYIESNREDRATTQRFDTTNNEALPWLNVAYLVNLALTLFANYGNSFGPVQNLQLNSQTATNPLKPELAKTAEVGARWQTQQIPAELTAFTIRFDNQILQVPGSTPAVFQNIGATSHEGIEAAIVYSFDKASALAGLNLYANYSYTKAIQKSGTTAGLDLSFYSRNTDTLGARYQLGDWAFNLASMHQSAQYADAANTVAEPADARLATRPPARSRAAGVRPRFRQQRVQAEQLAVVAGHRQGHPGLGGAGLPVAAHHRAHPLVAAVLAHRAGQGTAARILRSAPGGRRDPGAGDCGVGRQWGLDGLAPLGAFATTLSGAAPSTAPGLPKGSASAPALPLDTLVARAQAQFPGAPIGYVQVPAQADRPLRVRMRLADDPHPNGLSSVWLHPATGEVLAAHRWNELDPGARATAVIYPLHTGVLGGVLLEAVVALGGLALAAMGITGVWLWWMRRRPR